MVFYSMENCIFCKLYQQKKEIIYENQHSFVLININPLSKGHLLVIPKEHTRFFHELSDESISNVMLTIKKVVNKLNYGKYNILQNNLHLQSVFHVHFHIVPCTGDSSLKIDWKVIEVDSKYFEESAKEIRERLQE